MQADVSQSPQRKGGYTWVQGGGTGTGPALSVFGPLGLPFFLDDGDGMTGEAKTWRPSIGGGRDREVRFDCVRAGAELGACLGLTKRKGDCAFQTR